MGSRPHVGAAQLGRFFDTFIGPREISFDLGDDFVGGSTVVRDLTLNVRMGPGVDMAIPAVLCYDLRRQRWGAQNLPTAGVLGASADDAAVRRAGGGRGSGGGQTDAGATGQSGVPQARWASCRPSGGPAATRAPSSTTCWPRCRSATNCRPAGFSATARRSAPTSMSSPTGCRARTRARFWPRAGRSRCR